MSPETERRQSESSRTEAFSDGVFAIAITLLVLELAVPAVRDEFANDLLGEWATYVAYLAGFGTIGVLWLGHHTIFARIAHVDTGLLWRNLVVLLVASIFPFPTAVIASAFRLGSTADQAASVVLYAIVGMASGVAYLLLFTHLTSHPRLLGADADPAFLRPRAPLLTIAGYAVAGLLGWFISPALAVAIFLFFPISYIVTLRRATGG